MWIASLIHLVALSGSLSTTGHKLSAVRTLLERSQALISDKEDKLQEDKHVEKALQVCGDPDWTFEKVRDKLESAKNQKKSKKAAGGLGFTGTGCNTVRKTGLGNCGEGFQEASSIKYQASST